MKKTENMSRVEKNTPPAENFSSNNNGKYYYWGVIMVLIIIIIILLLLNRCGRGESELSPTGNSDVFNIDIDASCTCDDNTKCDSKNNNSGNSSKPSKGNKTSSNTNNTVPTWNDEDESENELGKVYVDDKNGNYLYHQKLNIFENPYFKYETKIAPGVSNSYAFEVHNDSDMNVKYYVEMYKECNYDLVLKYRLKRNGSYVLGDDSTWVKVEDLKTAFSNLNSGKTDKYVLDWKWEYEDGRDSKDTYIGENMNDAYKLYTKFYFEQI